MKDCPNCGQRIQDGAIKCKWCKSFVDKNYNDQVSSHRKCPFCSELILVEASKCKHCGEFLDDTVKKIRASNQPKSRALYIILGLFLGFFGAHDFYACYYGRGAVLLIITTLIGWTGIGLIIPFVWVIVELVCVTKDANGVDMY